MILWQPKRHYYWWSIFLTVFFLEISSWQYYHDGLGVEVSLVAQAMPLAIPNESTDSDSTEDEQPQYQSEALHNVTATISETPSKSRKLFPEHTPTTLSFRNILGKAFRKGMGGGIPGAIAGVIQVISLMWLRTVINHQSRYGASFAQSMKLLYKEGGISRFYNGLGFALLQAPASRFVATASNDGILALLSNLPATRHWGPGITTMFASTFVGFFRLLLMPIDTCKTVLQVDSQEGFRNLMKRVREGKISVLYAGSIATAVSAIIGHYPWFVSFNYLKEAEWLRLLIPSNLLRNAAIGLVSSIMSDAVVNVFRVIKTTKQSMGSKHDMSYEETIRMILAADGWKGLFGRGLRTRILANALQSVLFTVIWRGLAEHWGNGTDKSTGHSNSDSDIKSRIRGTPAIYSKPSQENPEEMIDLPTNHFLEHRQLNDTGSE
jgi:Mitochondrial carrier protein